METVKEIKKIAVIGPESTGKTTLCEQLAQHYNTLWCPEFAREYLLTHGMDYDYEDLLYIAKEQVAMEEEYIRMTKGENKSLPTATPLTTHHSPPACRTGGLTSFH
jgi:nicotinamide riboside kinase